jgi:hypothetical protein
MEVNLSDEHNNILPYFVIDQLFMQQSPHVLLYIATSFGLTYFTAIFGNYGILFISLLATSLFIYGTYEFINLEKASGDYNRNFNDFSFYIHK